MFADRDYDSMAAREIIELHEIIEDWIAGRCARDDAVYESRLLSRFTEDFFIVMPGGVSMPGSGLWGPMRDAYGSNPDFRIHIREVAPRAHLGEGAFVWTYEEWQRNAANSTPADNGRLSTVVFVANDARETGLSWAHVHETWLPASVIAAHRFDW